MSPAQADIAKALGRCTFMPGTSQKRFAKDIAYVAEYAPETVLTEKQDRYLRVLAWTMRRQMPASLVPAEKPV